MAAPSGTTWGSIAGDYGRIGIYIGLSNTDTTTTVTISTWFWSKYSVSDTNNAYYYNNNATTATTKVGSLNIQTSVASGSGWSTSNQVKLGQSTYTYDRGTSDIAKSCAIKLTNVDRVGATMTHSRSYTIPKLASYTVTYKANGGSGTVPATQTRYHGKDAITISNASSLSKTGYTFSTWNTKQNWTGTSYSPGSKYSGNANLVLYAQWTVNTFSVTYYPNATGVTNMPTSQTKTYGTPLSLSSTIPRRTNYNFKGWATSLSGSVSYTAGQTYSGNAALNLYAVWELGYKIPRISEFSATRVAVVDGDEYPSDDGTKLRLKFTCACDRPITEIKIECGISGEETSSSIQTQYITGIDTYGGTVDDIIEDIELNPEYTYSIKLTVTDELGSMTLSTYVNGLNIPFDILMDETTGPKGIAFGHPATTEGYMDVGYTARFNKPVVGKVYGLDILPGIEAGTDLNTCLTTGIYAIRGNVLGRTLQNGPPVDSNRCAGKLIVSTAFGGSDEDISWAYISQEYIPYDPCEPTYKRLCSSDGEGSWYFDDWVPQTVTGGELLWSGAWYMHGNQTATLKKAISAMPNGVVLMFSRYTNGASEDADFNSFFVPKQMIKMHSVYAHSFFMTGWRDSEPICASKYLYISDWEIVGVDSNDDVITGTIPLTNNHFVLRYVIGV